MQQLNEAGERVEIFELKYPDGKEVAIPSEEYLAYLDDLITIAELSVE